MPNASGRLATSLCASAPTSVVSPRGFPARLGFCGILLHSRIVCWCRLYHARHGLVCCVPCCALVGVDVNMKMDIKMEIHGS